MLPDKLCLIRDTKQLTAFNKLYARYIVGLEEQIELAKDGSIDTFRAIDNGFLYYSGIDLVIDYMFLSGILEDSEAYSQLGNHIVECFDSFIDRMKELEVR